MTELREAFPQEFEKMRRFVAAQADASNRPAQLRLDGIGIDLAAAAGEGKLPTFSMTAYTGGAMRLMGFWRPVVIDLEGMELPKAGEQMPIFLGHDPAQIVGHAEAWEKTQKTLKITQGVISGTGEAAREVVGNARNGFRWKASVGASVVKLEPVEAGATVKVNGQNFEGPLYVVRQSVLGEVSFVPIGADGRTSTRVAAAEAERLNARWLGWKFTRWLEERHAQ